MEEMKQVEIAGGGLAGLSLGIALREHDVPVIIREAGTYPRHRVCGEFVNGVTHETLTQLGLVDLFQDAFRHQKTCWWMKGEKVLEAELERSALGMSRWEMDERMRRRFEALGGSLRVKERVLRTPREGFVWAAGRLLDKKSSWFGLKAHFQEVELGDSLEMHLGEGGYVGLTPVKEGVNVCGLFRKRTMVKQNLMISYLRACRLDVLAERLERGELNEQSLTGISGFALGKQEGTGELCVLGDADRMIPPFTGNGMSMAFESAECALEPLISWARAEASWAECQEAIRDSLEQRFSKRMKLALGLHHFLITKWGRVGFSAAAKSGLIPFQWLHHNLR